MFQPKVSPETKITSYLGILVSGSTVYTKTSLLFPLFYPLVYLNVFLLSLNTKIKIRIVIYNIKDRGILKLNLRKKLTKFQTSLFNVSVYLIMLARSLHCCINML